MLALAESLFGLLPALAVIGNGAGVIWGNVVVLVVPSLVMVCLLLSAPMRQHVGLTRKHAAG